MNAVCDKDNCRGGVVKSADAVKDMFFDGLQRTAKVCSMRFYSAAHFYFQFFFSKFSLFKKFFGIFVK